MKVGLRFFDNHRRRCRLGDSHNDGHQKLLDTSAEILDVVSECQAVGIAKDHLDVPTAWCSFKQAKVRNGLRHEAADLLPSLGLVVLKVKKHSREILPTECQPLL